MKRSNVFNGQNESTIVPYELHRVLKRCYFQKYISKIMSQPPSSRPIHLNENFKNSVGTHISSSPSIYSDHQFKLYSSSASSSDDQQLIRCLLDVKRMHEQRISQLEQDNLALRAQLLSTVSPLSNNNVNNLGKSSSICRHFVQGRCRYHSLCRFSHLVSTCPHCNASLSPESAERHLALCASNNK